MTPKLAYELGVKIAQEENLKIPFMSDRVRERNRQIALNFLKGSVPGIFGGAALGAYLGDKLPWPLKPDMSTSMALGALKGGAVTGFLYSDFMRKFDESRRLEELNRKVDELSKGTPNVPNNQISI